jgi:hypothetical protein
MAQGRWSRHHKSGFGGNHAYRVQSPLSDQVGDKEFQDPLVAV